MARHPEIQYVCFYTDGSAARKPAQFAPIKTIKLPKIKKHKKITLRIDPIALAGIAMAAVMLVLMAVGVARLSSTREQLQTMSAYVDTLQQENTSLQNEFSQNFDLEEVQRTALALGLVPKDEVRHVSIRVPEVPQQEIESGTWERFYTFLTGLFA
jgi:hypothetical protein